VEPRDVGKWKGEEQNNGRQTNASARKGYAVAGAWPSAIDSESTERLADILVRGQVGPHLAEKPLTGKPDALCGQLGYVVPSRKTVDSLGFSYSAHHIIFSFIGF
jgi:hypothetical protein